MAIDQQPLPKGVWDSVADNTRLQTLEALEAMDSGDDPDFDRLTSLAADLFGVPVALITLVDMDRQWFKSCVGVDIRETPISQSFCAHAIAGRAPYMVINDATKDERFTNNPLVTGEMHIRFYAGAPIVVQGEKLGTLCVIDRVAHEEVSEKLLDHLVALAQTASALFELKDEARVRARTAAELIKEEWRHALTLEAGQVGSWVWDNRTGEVVANDILRRMFGIDSLRAITINDIFDAMHEDDRPHVEEALQATFDEGVDYASEFRVADERWLIGRGRVYQRDSAGKPLIMMGVNIDITDARQAADHTRFLLRELNHRVKNTLAMIQSLARQTLTTNADPQALLDFSGRLATLSEAHALLSDRDWSGIGINELIDTRIMPYASDAALQVIVSGHDLQLPPDHALGLGLIFHELASNAAKYGALSTPRGRVEITWTLSEASPQRLDLTWQEIGGPEVATKPKVNLGVKLIQRSLDKILDSAVNLDFPRTGAEARISFPVAAVG